MNLNDLRVKEASAVKQTLTKKVNARMKAFHNIATQHEFNIESKFQLHNLRKTMIKNEDAVTIYDLTASSDGGHVGHVTMYGNRAMRHGWFHSRKLNVLSYNHKLDKRSVTEIDNFCSDIVTLHVNDKKTADMILLKGLYIGFYGVHTKIYMTDGEKYFDFLNHEEVPDTKLFNATGALKANFHRYTGFGYSASKLRKMCLYMIDVTNGDDYAESLLNDATCMAYGILKGKEVSFEKLAKLTNYNFLWTAPSALFGIIGNYLFFNGKWEDSEGNNFLDGACYIDNMFYAMCASGILEASVNPNAVIGEGVQVRFATAKCFGIVVVNNFMTEQIKKYKALKKFIHFDKSELTADVIKDINNPKGPYVGWLIQVGDDNQVYFDRNGLKMDCDLSQDFDMDVLDIAKASQAQTSMQMLEKALAIDTTATIELMKKAYRAQIEREVLNTLINRKPAVPSMEEVMREDVYAAGLVTSINPFYATNRDRAIYSKMVENFVERTTKLIDGVNIELYGSNLRLTADPAKLFDVQNILKYGEVFAKDATRYFKDKDVDKLVTMFKYPTIGVKEFYQATVVDFKEIKKRILNLECTREVKEVLISFYASMSDSVLVVPAVEFLKNQLAGLDFDYDGATVIYDEDFNAIMKKEAKPTIVCITKSKKEARKLSGVLANSIASYKSFGEETFKVCISNFAVTFVRQANNKNLGIGQITNANSSQVELMFDPDTAKEVMESAFGDTNTHDYVGLTVSTVVVDGIECNVIYVTKEEAENVAEEIKHSKYTKESLPKILFDMNVLYRMYQENTIDSAKTGEVVAIHISLRKHCWANSLAHINASINSKNRVAYSSFIPDSKREIVFKDVLSTLKRDIIKETKEMFDQVILPRVIEYTNDDMAMFERYGLVQYRDLVQSLIKTKLYYNDITGGHRAIMATIDSEDEDAKTAQKKQYRKQIKSLTGLIRKLTDGMDPVDAVSILKYVSMISKDGLRKDGGSAFASVVMPNEYVQMVMKVWGGNDFAGYEIINPKCESGDIVEFRHGVSDYGMIKEAYTGRLEVVEINGKLYAGKKISNIMPISKDTSTAVLRIKDSSFKGKTEEIMANLESATVTIKAGVKFMDGVKKFEYNVSKDGKVIAEIDTDGKIFNNIINESTGTVDMVNVISTTNEDGSKFERMYLFLKDMNWSNNTTVEPEVTDWSAVEEIEEMPW